MRVSRAPKYPYRMDFTFFSQIRHSNGVYAYELDTTGLLGQYLISCRVYLQGDVTFNSLSRSARVRSLVETKTFAYIQLQVMVHTR